MRIQIDLCGEGEFSTGNGSVNTHRSSKKKDDAFRNVRIRRERELVLDELPEDVFDRIYFLLPMKDAARAACVSRRFLCSWRCYPKLVFDKQTLCLEKVQKQLMVETMASKDALLVQDNHERDLIISRIIESKIESHYIDKIEHILKNRSESSTAVKVFTLKLFHNVDAFHLDKWLQIAMKPGIEDLIFERRATKVPYTFPCVLLSGEMGGKTLQSLRLYSCAFHPSPSLGYNTTLTSLSLRFVSINTVEELGQFVSSCLALTRLQIHHCDDIFQFKVQNVLRQLRHLEVTECEMLQGIEISAPNLSRFVYGGTVIPISLGADVKDVSMVGFSRPNMIYQARSQVPSFMPSVEKLTVESGCEMLQIPVVHNRFLSLKYLDICFDNSDLGYDYFQFISFLDASPVLETFSLRVICNEVRHDSILREYGTGGLCLRTRPSCRHDNLKSVRITGFNSAKTLIELTRHIVERSPTLSCLTLDTAWSCVKNKANTFRCKFMTNKAIIEAKRADLAIREYVVGLVPSSVNLKVLNPCIQCE